MLPRLLADLSEHISELHLPFETVQVYGAAQTVGPLYPWPPHWP